jgi:hypothetical protein
MEQFTLIQGSLTAFPSSPGVTRSFCGICGSPLTYRTERHPTLIDIMTGSLDDPERFPPTHHVWMSHKLNWDRIADGLPHYPTSRPK